MRLPMLHRFLLVLALVASQWLTIAHAHEHPALSFEPHCQFCLHAPGIDTAALASKPATLTFSTQSVALPTPKIAHVTDASRDRIRIRGPPQIAVV